MSTTKQPFEEQLNNLETTPTVADVLNPIQEQRDAFLRQHSNYNNHRKPQPANVSGPFPRIPGPWDLMKHTTPATVVATGLHDDLVYPASSPHTFQQSVGARGVVSPPGVKDWNGGRSHRRRGKKAKGSKKAKRSKKSTRR